MPQPEPKSAAARQSELVMAAFRGVVLLTGVALVGTLGLSAWRLLGG